MNPAPYSDDPVTIKQLKNIDYSHRITIQEADSGKVSRPVRIYADGIFDLFHFGHQLMLKQAKNVFPNVYLIAGVSNDSETHQIKGLTIDFVAHEDCPYPMPDGGDYYQRFRDAGMFVSTNRTKGISTTEIIDRIIDDFNGFVKRNTSRQDSRHSTTSIDVSM